MKPFTTVVPAKALAEHYEDPDWIVFDCRHSLADPDLGATSYAGGHIPGAYFLHLDQDLSGPKNGRNGRHPLPDPLQLAAHFSVCGLRDGMQVVAYDDAGGMFAARLWWLLRWLGHDAVAVLDGGLQTWKSCNYPLSSQTPERRPRKPEAVFIAHLQPSMVVDATYVRYHLDDAQIQILDARAPDRFRGENETLDPVGGHIPGAVNRFFKDNLQADGQFKPASQLRSEFMAVIGKCSPKQIVHQCGSGVTACHNMLAMEIAGLVDSRLYAGSWSEWCSDPNRPVAKG